MSPPSSPPLYVHALDAFELFYRQLRVVTQRIAELRATFDADSFSSVVRAATDLNSALGPLCLRGRCLPRNLPEFLKLIDEPNTRVQLLVCMSNDGHGGFLAGSPTNPMPIEVPPLAIREAELPRIVHAYANDVIVEPDAEPSCFSDDDCKWVMKHAAASLSQIEKATLRIVAVNMSGNVHRAAKRLRMATVSLFRWLRCREALPHFAMDRTS